MKVLSRARPIRIAYFIEESPNWSLALDAIAQASFGTWGGRFHLIVPCKDGAPEEAFVPWLKSYDPDIIYSYCDLNEEIVVTLHESLYPAFLIRHRINNPEQISVSHYLPNYPLRPLSVETVIPYAAIPAKYQGELPSVVDARYGKAGSDVFVQMNFGQFTGSTNHSYPQYLNEFGTPIHILSDAELQPRQHYALGHLRTFEDRETALKQMANKRILTVANLSSYGVHRWDIPASTWGRSFSVIVGDSFIDRIAFWNGRALFPSWRDGDYVDLYIPEKDLDDQDLLEAISEFIRRRNNITLDSGNSNPQATVRSSSIGIERLEETVLRLRGQSSWIQYRAEQIKAALDYVPRSKNIDDLHFASPNSLLLRSRTGWAESETSGDQIGIKPTLPDHFEVGSPVLTSSHMGAWAIDLIIPRSKDFSQHSNENHHWQFPRRLRITSAFKKGHELHGDRAIGLPRVSSGGFLCLFADSKSDVVFRIPSDEAAIRTGFVSGRDWWPFMAKHDGTSEMPEQLAYAVERSSNGQYFWGVLNMFGGLPRIRDHLLHSFWRNQFELLGASPSRTQERKQVVIDVLKRRLRKRLNSPVSEALEAVADRVLEEAELHRSRNPTVEWPELQSAHTLLIENYWKKHPLGKDEGDISNWKMDQGASLEPSIQRLCRMGALHQGYEMKCRKCLHKFWVSIDTLKTVTTCEVCSTSEQAPIGRPWAFRLNEFFREALRAHGILPLFWALQKSRLMHEQSFYFEGPLNVYFDKESFEKGEPDTDIDLTVISNGIVQMFEVKQSERQMQKAIEFASVARRLRPDIATIAIMEPTSIAIQRKYEEFARSLAGTGIKPQLLTLESDRDFSDNPSLAERAWIRMF